MPLYLMSLYGTVLAMMLKLAPSDDPIARHGALATAISVVATEEGALFANDPKLERTVSLLVAVAFRESSLTANIVGDGGRSVCAMQIHGGSASLNEDPIACVRVGHKMLKVSIGVDRTNPVAFYARGPRYTSEEARRISRDRMALARSLLSR